MKRLFALALALSVAASANYHFVRYSNELGYQQPIYEKFDLRALVNNTVPFFIVRNGLERVADGDNVTAVMSQIIAAGRVWNDVETSELRVAFGGYTAAAASAPQSSPGIDIIFDDLAPGIISMAGPTLKADTVTVQIGDSQHAFTPILRSQIIFRKDVYNLKSYSEDFFLNAVHEFGHALGLQHTFTSGTMSTQITRATTRSKPLAADDVAGISILYPSKNFEAQFGSIRGRITQNGAGVNLASVVALSMTGVAVSTLTNPDGTYIIRGIPPGPYTVYAHPIPPALAGELTPGNIILPRDPENRAIPVNNLFDLQFFPGTRDANAARSLQVNAGETIGSIDFEVNRRATQPTLFYPSTFSYFGQVSVRPAFITPQVVNPLFVATGFGFVTPDSQPAPGLRASILGGSPAISRTRGWTSQFLIFDLFLSGFLSEGERHLVLERDGETTVLPSAIQVANRRAPRVTNVNWAGTEANGERIVLVTGTDFDASSRVMVDGERAYFRGFEVLGEGLVQMRVSVPSGPTGHVARVVVLNSDGQSSLLGHADGPAQLAYSPVNGAPLEGFFTISPTQLPAGVETVVEIDAPGAEFREGQVRIGFGTSDAIVRAIQIVHPGRVRASVFVAARAETGRVPVTVVSGLQQMTQSGAAQIVAPPSAAQTLRIQGGWLAENGTPFVTAGSIAYFEMPGYSGGNLQVLLNGFPVDAQHLGEGRVRLVLPSNAAIGMGLLEARVDGAAVPPVLVRVYGNSPFIERLASSEEFVIDSARPAVAGDTLTVRFRDPSAGIEERLRANQIAFQVGEQTIYTLRASRVDPRTFEARFVLPRNLETGSFALRVLIDGRPSSPVPLPVRSR